MAKKRYRIIRRRNVVEVSEQLAQVINDPTMWCPWCKSPRASKVGKCEICGGLGVTSTAPVFGSNVYTEAV